ncbi:putative bifunctional diguanylate cyclase/phosphodiesterase [Actinoplanes palleronii]|uniref:putative bifunctional diguanylate cyclase/phosphodiesterase n=1 Tax=Actinoplanes palleronii TaxID=113570 RepID=UPI001EF3D30A|nr:EAL domain-containing protein [Actinoplanes palleronii]
MRNGRVQLWAGWLMLAAVAALCFPLLPDDTLPTKIYVNTVGTTSVLMMVVGILRNRPEHRGPWLMFAAGMAMLVSGDITYDVTELRLGEYPYPSWADLLYLCAYPFLLVPGMIRLSRGNGDRDRGGLIDAAVISTGIGLIYWVFVVGPTLAESSTPALERMVTIGYPMCDVMLTAAVARMFTRPENRTPSLRLLGIGTILMLTGDLFYTTMSTTAEYTGGFVDSGFLLAYACWGAAALHPSMRQRPTAAGIDPYGIGGRRLAVLAACSLLAPGLLFLQGVKDPGNIAWGGIGVGAVTLFLLVIARNWGFVKQVQRQAGKLEDLAMHDELTGLSNRRGFERSLSTALAAGSPHVLLLDLNGFKSVNDRFGHAVGDDLLVVIAHRLSDAMPDGAMVARMGGDEFAVLLPGCATQSCDELAERLHTVIRLPIHVGGQDLLVGASIGIADADFLIDPVEVLRRADLAMYAAKAAGGRHHRWYVLELDTQAGEEARLGADLRVGMDAGQLHLVYQPIVELPGGAPQAVESLIRWQHPERGFVSPVEFIPVAERNGLIIELGMWILRTACEQYRTWQARGVAPEHIGVNVSARQLAEPGFVDAVAAVLAETGMDPHHLVVEITETAVFGGGVAVRAVHELNALGIAIALDDFGTGHSSLGILQAVPVKILKVDKSFVENVTVSDRHAVIAASLIQLTGGLGLIAVAEGVETPEQAAELYRLGYRRAQGYHFGRPVVDPFAPAALSSAA